MFDTNKLILTYRGRVALYLMLKGLGVGRGDKVAVQAFTCIAVPEGVMATGAKPLWIDIVKDGVTMDAGDLASKLDKTVKAIVVQHTYGIPADINPLKEIANDFNIPIIEDCAHTYYSTYKGKRVGTFGVGSFYSFEWGKPLVAGIGGAAVFNDEHLYQKVKGIGKSLVYPDWKKKIKLNLQYYAFKILNRPILYWPVKRLFHILGSLGMAESNYNPVESDKELAADFGMTMISSFKQNLFRQIPDIENNAGLRISIAEKYRKSIKNCSTSIVPEDSKVVLVRYPLWADNKKYLLKAAKKQNIELSEWYSSPVHPLDQHEWLSVGYQAKSCPNAEIASKRIITLPIHKNVSNTFIAKAASFINKNAENE